MKVALYDPITTGHHPEYAGYIVEYLLESGDDILYITPDRSDRTSIVEKKGAKIKFIGRPTTGNPITSSPRILLNLKAGLEAAASWEADLFHHLFVDTREPAITAALFRSDLPILLTLFNPHFDREGSYIGCLYGSFCLGCLDLFSTVNSFNGLFVHTSRIKDRIIRQSRRLREGDLHVIPDPVELPDQQVSKETARELLNIDGPEPVFLYFGGLRKEKGPQLLLNVIEKLDRDATFVIAGSGDAISTGDICATKERSRANIYANLEFIPDSQIYTYFFACDATVLPYRPNYSGTSGILQRSAAAERPIIATAVGEIGPIVNEHNLGYVVEPDAYSLLNQLSVFDTQTAQDEFGTHLHNYARNHTVRRFVNDVRSVYSNSIN